MQLVQKRWYLPTMQKRRTVEAICAALLPHVATLGRMPSHQELMTCGETSLANAAARFGYPKLRELLGVEEKDSTVSRGTQWEKHVIQLLTDLQYEVKHMCRRSPFDLLVNGQIRVEVKSASKPTYRQTGYKPKLGHVFVFRKGCADNCDVFALVAAQAGQKPRILWVPKRLLSHAGVLITPQNRFWFWTNPSAAFDLVIPPETKETLQEACTVFRIRSQEQSRRSTLPAPSHHVGWVVTLAKGNLRLRSEYFQPMGKPGLPQPADVLFQWLSNVAAVDSVSSHKHWRQTRLQVKVRRSLYKRHRELSYLLREFLEPNFGRFMRAYRTQISVGCGQPTGIPEGSTEREGSSKS